jgi:uncharacterized repeat protein (TIGR01451 family)
MRRSLVLMLGMAAAAVLIGGAGGATSRLDLSTRAGVMQYLKAHGIDTHGIVIQRGNRNYVGARCPGAGWTCTRASRVVQVASGLNAVNQADLTTDNVAKSCTDGTPIVQLSTGAGNNTVMASMSTGSCSAVQQTDSGTNMFQLEQAVQQTSGSSQSASQGAFVTQYNLTGQNSFQLRQSVSQSISESVNPVNESQTSTQTFAAYQFNDSGPNSSQVTESLSQSESDTRATSGFQTQNATLQGHVDQYSTGLSTSQNKQFESQTQTAKSSGNVVQTQHGPMDCCSIQQNNSGDIFRIDQSATQTQTPGKNGSSRQEQIGGECHTSGLCKVSQSYTLNGQTTTNFCQGSDCTITVTNSGEGVQKCTSGCEFGGGEFPGPANPPGGSYCSAFLSVSCPTLAIDKTADAASVDAGSTIGFTVTLTNSGSADATGVKIHDPLPGGVGVNWSLDESSNSSCSLNGEAPAQVVTCDSEGGGGVTVSPDSTITFHVTGSTSCNVTSGTFDNTATYISTNAGNGSASDSETVAPASCPDLSITKAPDAAAVPVAGSVGFTVDLTNNGGADATGVVMTDSLPTGPASGTTWIVDADPADACSIDTEQTLSCDFGTIAPGATATVHVTSSATTCSDLGTYDNTANYTSSNAGEGSSLSASEAVTDPEGVCIIP